MITQSDLEAIERKLKNCSEGHVRPADLTGIVLANEVAKMVDNLEKMNATLAKLVKPFEAMQVMQAGVKH